MQETNSSVFISSFAYCESTSLDIDNGYNITLLPFIRVSSFPENISVKAVCSISGIDSFNNDTIRAFFKDPDGYILSQFEWRLDDNLLHASNGNVPDALIFHFTISCNIEKSGIFCTEILFNQNILGTYYIHAGLKVINHAE